MMAGLTYGLIVARQRFNSLSEFMANTAMVKSVDNFNPLITFLSVHNVIDLLF